MSVIEKDNNKNPMKGHRFISDPVNTNDVSKVLGRSSLDVGALCSAGSYINRWARYKPVRWGHVSSLAQWDSTKTAGIDGWGTTTTTTKWKTTGGDISTNGKWWLGNGNCGINVTIFQNLMTMVDTCLAANYDWRNMWQYLPPRGNENNVNEPYRLTDFAGYCHFMDSGEDFDKPLAGWTMPTDITKYLQDNEYVIDAQSSVTRRQWGDAYLLTFDDIILDVSHNKKLADYYFGIAIDNGLTGGNRKVAFQTCHYNFTQDAPYPNNYDLSSGYDYRCTPLLNPLSFPAVGTYKVFPFLSKNLLESSAYTEAAYRTTSDSNMAIECIPLPFGVKEVSLSIQTATIKMKATITSMTCSSGSSTIKIQYTASPIVSGALAAGWDAIPILIQVFYDGQSPAGWSSDAYSVPASSDSGWSASGNNKVYTTQNLSLGGSTSGKNSIMVTLMSGWGYISTEGDYKTNV